MRLRLEWAATEVGSEDVRRIWKLYWRMRKRTEAKGLRRKWRPMKISAPGSPVVGSWGWERMRVRMGRRVKSVERRERRERRKKVALVPVGWGVEMGDGGTWGADGVSVVDWVVGGVLG